MKVWAANNYGRDCRLTSNEDLFVVLRLPAVIASAMRLSGKLSFGGDRLEAGVEAGLVTRNGVLVEDALLDALVESGDGLAELDVSGVGIALGDGLAEGAKAGAHAGAVGAVNRGPGLGLAGALQRRYMVCHSASFV
jgi:hypothetical protein